MVLKLNKSQNVDKMFRLLTVFKCKCLHFARVLFINGSLFFNNAYVRNIVEAAKRQNAKPIVKKSPISREVLTACFTKYEHSTELPIRRDISMALLLFAVFVVLVSLQASQSGILA